MGHIFGVQHTRTVFRFLRDKMPFFRNKKAQSEKSSSSDNILRFSANNNHGFAKWLREFMSIVTTMGAPVPENAVSLMADDQDAEIEIFHKRFVIGDQNHNNSPEIMKLYTAALVARRSAATSLFNKMLTLVDDEFKRRLEENQEFKRLVSDGRIDPARLKQLIQTLVMQAKHTNPLLTVQELLGEVTRASAHKYETADEFLVRFQRTAEELESLGPLNLIQGTMQDMKEAAKAPVTPSKSASAGGEKLTAGFSEAFYVLAAIRGLPASVSELKNDLLKTFDTDLKVAKDFPKSIEELRARCDAMLKRKGYQSQAVQQHRLERPQISKVAAVQSHLTTQSPKDKKRQGDKRGEKRSRRDSSPSPSPSPTPSANSRERKCYLCGKPGHVRTECPDKTDGIVPRSEIRATIAGDAARLFNDASEEDYAELRKSVRIHSTQLRGDYPPMEWETAWSSEGEPDTAPAHSHPIPTSSEPTWELVYGVTHSLPELNPTSARTTGELETVLTDSLDELPLKKTGRRRLYSTLDDIIDDEPEGIIVLLDGCANMSVVSSEEMCTNVTHKNTWRSVVSTFGEKKEVFPACGTLHIGGVAVRVLINPHATANIVSERQYEWEAKRQGYRIERHDGGKSSELRVVRIDDGEITAKFGWFRGLRATEIPRSASVYLGGYGLELTADQMARAIKAREAEERLGYISTELMKMALSRGGVEIKGIKPRDAQLAKEAIGVSPVRAKAISTRDSVKLIKISKEYPAVVEQAVHGDTFFVNDKAFLVTKSVPMGFIAVYHLKGDKSHGLDELKQKLLWNRRMLEDRGYRVTETHYDGEMDQSQTSELRPPDYPGLVIHPPDQHVGIAERSVRSIKDILRCFVIAKPRLPWSGRFLVEAVTSMAFYANIRYSKAAPETPSPIQQIVGRSILYERDIPAALGDLVLVEKPPEDRTKKSNIETPRMEEAVFLRPSMDAHSSAIVLILRSGKVLKRTNVKPVLWTEEMLDKLWKWSGAKRTDQQEVWVRKRSKDIERRLRDVEPDTEPEYDRYVVVGSDELPAHTRHQAGCDLPKETPAVAVVSSTEQSHAVLTNGDAQAVAVERSTGQSRTTLAKSVTQAVAVGRSTGQSRTASAKRVTQTGAVGNSPEQSQPILTKGTNKRMKSVLRKPEPLTPYTSNLDVEPTSYADGVLHLETADGGGTRKSSRVRRVSFKLLNTVTGMPIESLTTTVARSWKDVQGLEDITARNQAIDALRAELNNIFIAHPALVPVARQDIVRGKSELLPMSFFIDRKYVGGSYVKTKARLVAGGHRQDDETYKLFSSQTVSTESLFIILAIAQFEGRSCGVADVTGAFLNAPMEHPDSKIVYLKLNADLANLLISILPQYKDLVNPDGSLYVRADRAIYGCKQSSFLWQKFLTQQLVDLGFTISKYDKCVAYRISDGTIVAFHVDDLFIAAKTVALRDSFIAEFRKKFPITSHVGPILNYLGMTMEFVDGTIEVNQHAFVGKLIEGIMGTVSTPMIATDLEAVNTTPLSDTDAALYRSIVAKCLYLAKRTRPDILFAVNVLARAAQAPTIMDKNRLQRVLKYLNYSRLRILKIHAKNIRLTAYIDAAFATHSDRKSHTGAIIQLGGALIWAKSVKQSIVTKSSTEAELVALSDMASMLLWASFLLSELGYAQKDAPPLAYQDNTSTIAITHKGSSSSERTRHIDTRYMWIKELLDNGRMAMEYCPTAHMTADIMTKALGVEAFRRHVLDLNIVDAKDTGTYINLLIARMCR